jgi:hypothetical protein
LIDFNDPHWIKQLPLSSVKSLKEVNQHYGVSLTQGNWLFVYRATRETADLSAGKRHGFLEVVIPRDDGNYATYPFGQYPDDFPFGLFASIAFIDATSYSSIAYPDDNINYPHRQHAFVPIPISPEEGLAVIESIRQDLLKSRNNNLIFQTRYKNCAYRVQKTSKKILSCQTINPYKIKISQTDTFAFIDKLPKKFQAVSIALLDTILGASRGITINQNGKKVFKSTSLIPESEKKFIYQPGWLHEQVLSGKLPGRVYAGHP